LREKSNSSHGHLSDRVADPYVRDSRPLVLLVEDSPDTRELYAEILRISGFRVATAETGFEAVVNASCLVPDVILMDLSLPGIDGWEATRLIKQSPPTMKVPIVAFTAYAQPEYLERAKDAGCCSILTKPCVPEMVVGSINAAILPARQHLLDSASP
jgi:two-component system, cell cycle response regulator DivK